MLLFLDFDGVLHPEKCECDQYFTRIDLLETFLQEEAPDWNIVISSSWREYYPLDDMIGFLPESLAHRIVGITPFNNEKQLLAEFGAQTKLYPRQIEIMSYLNTHGLKSEPWVALDDMGHWFFDPLTNPNLVLCQGKVGLTENEIQKLRERVVPTHDWSTGP